MRGTVTHWASNQSYGFVAGEDGCEYVLRDESLPVWMQIRKASVVGEHANAQRVGLIVEFEVRETGSRKPDCKNVFVLGPPGENDPLRK